MTKVYAAQEPMVKGPTGHWVRNTSFALDDLDRFGSVRFVWAPGAAMYHPDDIRQRAEEIAADYNDRIDWIVALGSPTLIAILAHAIGAAGKKLRMLEWQRRERRYAPTAGDF